VAAPGVDILALAPGDRCSSRPARQSLPPMSAGSRRSCSNASPRSSRPTFAPTGTAKPLGSGTKLVNAYRAVMSLNAEASGKDGSAEAKQ
jgi:hypothetical protein